MGFTGDEGIMDLPKLRNQRHRGDGAQHHMCFAAKLEGTLTDPDTQRPPSSALHTQVSWQHHGGALGNLLLHKLKFSGPFYIIQPCIPKPDVP